MQALSLENIHFGYNSGDEPALDIDTLKIDAGERVALIGPSGAGKSTLLRLIDGRLRNWSGNAAVLGETISSHKTPGRAFSRKIGFVFQEFALVERQTVFENVRNGRLGHLSTVRSVLGRLAPEDYKQILTAIEETGLNEFMHRRADELSGGQRQRVAVARCLAQQPGMILADEPISNLDPVRAREILDLLVKVCELRHATLIITTHQPMLVRTYVDRIVALSEGAVILDEKSSPASAAQVMAVYEQMVDPLADHSKPASA